MLSESPQNIRLRAEAQGPAKGSVLLFHGLTTGPGEMEELAESLHGLGFHVLVPILSGHMTSVEDLGQVPLRRWVGEVEVAFAKLLEDEPLPLHLVGLSFGGIIASYLATRYSSRVESLSLLSVPYRLSSSISEVLLRGLSYAPEGLLSRLWTIPKEAVFISPDSRERKAYDRHSVGALARLVKLRRVVDCSLENVSCRTLILQDPMDHHLKDSSSLQLMSGLSSAQVELSLVPHGRHDLLHGPKRSSVIERVIEHIHTTYSGGREVD